ncbi:MAG: hypothetical protein AAGG09_05550 [Pseudomonadota bacterium]
MRLPVFLVGLGVVVAASVLAGTAAGFAAGTLVLFVVAAVIVAQLAYVGLVAVLARGKAAERRAQQPDEQAQRPARVPQGQVSQEHDA